MLIFLLAKEESINAFSSRERAQFKDKFFLAH
jgi:hypothetical protein